VFEIWNLPLFLLSYW